MCLDVADCHFGSATAFIEATWPRSHKEKIAIRQLLGGPAYYIRLMQKKYVDKNTILLNCYFICPFSACYAGAVSIVISNSI